MNHPIGSLFLGPSGENADVLETFLLDALRDHVYWRRNFHPEDGPYIAEGERRSPGYAAAQARLRQELFGLLARLKQGAPLFSPRYIAHMSSDVMLASLIGYFAAMLYNPNNISEEASPVTTELELAVGAELAQLVGYGPEAWGHLASGGSVANLEALWVVRALKYFPIAARLVAEERPDADVGVIRADGRTISLASMSPWQLMNLSVAETLDLHGRLIRLGHQDPTLLERLDEYSIGSQGMLGLHRLFAERTACPLPEPVLLVPASKHYSWVKGVDLLGLGRNQLRELPLDADYRIDPERFRTTLWELAEREVPVLALVAVIGTTETGSVDALHELCAARREVASRGLDFYVHADAAYGGYATSMFRWADGSWLSGGLNPELAASFEALQQTDSVTIDPHKLGYAPYPAGAIVFRDRRMRDLIPVTAPYVFHSPEDGRVPMIGKYIIEGSKPGAAAAAVWLNHRVLSLDATGYGALIGRTVSGAQHLREALSSFQSRNGCALIPLNEPDLNVVTFIAVPPAIGSLEALNRFNEALYERLAIHPDRRTFSYEFVVSKTEFDVATCRAGLERRCPAEVQSLLRPGAALTVLRSTVMNPFLPDAMAHGGYLPELLSALEAEMSAVMTRQDHPITREPFVV